MLGITGWRGLEIYWSGSSVKQTNKHITFKARSVFTNNGQNESYRWHVSRHGVNGKLGNTFPMPQQGPEQWSAPTTSCPASAPGWATVPLPVASAELGQCRAASSTVRDTRSPSEHCSPSFAYGLYLFGKAV